MLIKKRNGLLKVCTYLLHNSNKIHPENYVVIEELIKQNKKTELKCIKIRS